MYPPLEVGVKGNTSPPPILTFSLREVECLRRSKTIEKRHPRTAFFYGRDGRLILKLLDWLTIFDDRAEVDQMLTIPKQTLANDRAIRY